MVAVESSRDFDAENRVSGWCVWLDDESKGLRLSEVVAREAGRRQSEKTWKDEECW